MPIGASASKTAIGNNRGTEPVTTPGSPDKRTVEAGEEERDDFGYGAGAAEIHALFAARFRDARRRLPRHEVPFALASLRDEKTSALAALKRHCHSRRLEARTAKRDLERRAHRPAASSRVTGLFEMTVN